MASGRWYKSCRKPSDAVRAIAPELGTASPPFKSQRRRIHDQVDVPHLESKRALLPRDRVQSRHRTQNFRTGKEFAQILSKRLCLFKSSIGYDQPLAVFSRALKRDCAGRAARPKNQHAQIAKVDRKLFTNGARESPAVGVETMQFSAFDLDRIDAPPGAFAFASTSSTNSTPAILCGTVRLKPAKSNVGEQ